MSLQNLQRVRYYENIAISWAKNTFQHNDVDLNRRYQFANRIWNFFSRWCRAVVKRERNNSFWLFDISHDWRNPKCFLRIYFMVSIIHITQNNLKKLNINISMKYVVSYVCTLNFVVINIIPCCCTNLISLFPLMPK